MKYRYLFILPVLAVAITAQANCFHQASKRYGIHPDLLRAISTVESAGNAKAVNHNHNGSRDIGHMQINSSWLPKLKKYGITEQSLFDPCTNTLVGAWVLAGNFRDLGYNWDAIGAYNAKSADKRRIYARKVSEALRNIRGGKQ